MAWGGTRASEGNWLAGGVVGQEDGPDHRLGLGTLSVHNFVCWTSRLINNTDRIPSTAAPLYNYTLGQR